MKFPVCNHVEILLLRDSALTYFFSFMVTVITFMIIQCLKHLDDTLITDIVVYWGICFHAGFSFLKYYRYLWFIPRILALPYSIILGSVTDFTYLYKTYILLGHFLFAVVKFVGDGHFPSYFIASTSISEAVFMCASLVAPCYLSQCLWVPAFAYDMSGSHSFVLILFLISGRCLG